MTSAFLLRLHKKEIIECKFTVHHLPRMLSEGNSVFQMTNSKPITLTMFFKLEVLRLTKYLTREILTTI
jgi:hypothetical protein